MIIKFEVCVTIISYANNLNAAVVIRLDRFSSLKPVANANHKLRPDCGDFI